LSKILIVYNSAGSGHKRVAQAIFKEFSIKFKDVKIIDALDYTNSFFKFIYTDGYFFLSAYLPKIWRFFFYLCENRLLSLFVDFIRFYANRLNSKKLNKFLIKERPDIVIGTHFFINEVISFLKKRGSIKSYLISVITDFCAHRFWIQEGVDLYIVGTKETKKESVKKGVSEDKIKILGIPVDRKFYAPQDKRFLCEGLGLREDMFTILIVTGTFGSNMIRKVVDHLKDEIQIICVCGRNKRLFNKLVYRGYRFTKVYGLVENMDELMSVSDLIITKPGGSTISEALVKSLPMVFISMIPGQEEENAKILVDLGIGIIPKNIKDLKRIVFSLKEERTKLYRMRERIREISKFSTREVIFDEICKGSCKYSG